MEHPSISPSVVELESFEATVTNPELTLDICVEAVETFLPLLPSWSVGGASATTDNQQYRGKYLVKEVKYQSAMHIVITTK